MEDIWLQECDEHTLDQHIEVHESGHALAAIDNGIVFSQIAVYGENGKPGLTGGLYVAAAEVVMHDEDPVTYVAPNPLGALRFCLAGHCAESAILGHGMPDAEASDIATWKAGVGLPLKERVSETDLDARAGQSFAAVAEQTEQWAHTNAARILRLADHLGTLPRPSTMSYEEVAAFI